ncbi:MAG TPA: complex I NDUFA9 subunit family protein [Candidatus Limnocylindria bacterium]
MRIAITGANGFVGRHVVALLAEDEAADDIRALVRDPSRAAEELPRAGLDVRRADVTDPASLRGAFDGLDAVVHTVAIPTKRQGSFARVNAEGARAVVREAERAGIHKIVHLSAIGASPQSPYPFLRSKGEGQAAVEASAVAHVVLRPSILFGPGDDFFPRLRFSLAFPVVPLPGGGTARFQPLHVEDLALAIRAALRGPMTGTFEVGGADPVTYRQMLEETMRAYRKRRPTVPMPILLMKPAAFLFERTMADPPVTVRQLDLLAVDNTPQPNAIDRVFGVQPRAFLGGGLSYLGQRSSGS